MYATHARRLYQRMVASSERQAWRAFSAAASRIPFLLADIGEGIAEVEVMQWHVKKGDKVKQFQPLVEVQSDKATVEITSRYDGIVDELQYDEGDIARVGQPLCFIQQDGVAVAQGASEEETGPPKKQTDGNNDPSTPKKEFKVHIHEEAEVIDGPKPLATPAVRRVAKEMGVSLAAVRASGRGGRITKEDVERHASELAQRDGASASEPDEGLPDTAPAGLASAVRTEEVRGLRRVMVRTMAAATAVPHLGLGDEVQVDKLVGLVQELKAESAGSGGGGAAVSLMPFFIKAGSLALLEFPLLNARVSEDCELLHYHTDHNIGVAMDTAAGLAVPNIKRVQLLSLAEIATEMMRLKKAAQSGKFDKADCDDGTFTLSNVGSIGGTYASPVIPVPQVAIGAIGRIRVVPRFDDDGDVVPANIMHVSWSADHRVVDGATVARFSNAWKEFIERPERMLIHLK